MPSKEIIEAERNRKKPVVPRKANIREQLLEAHKAERSRINGKSKRWEELIARIPVAVPTRGAEIGVWKGATSKQVLQKRPLTTLLMIDSWRRPPEGSRYAETPGTTQHRPQEVFDEAYEGVLAMAQRYGERGLVMAMYSKEAAEEVSNHSLDYVFIDAEHTYEGVKEDIALWSPKVKHGGWIGGHDYNNLPNFPGVKKAVDEAFPDGVELGADHVWFKRIL